MRKNFRVLTLSLTVALALVFFWAPLPHCDHLFFQDSCSVCLLHLSVSNQCSPGVVAVWLWLVLVFLLAVSPFLFIQQKRVFTAYTRAPPLS
ncbi:MAG TPA: hypothetical protein PKX93_00075 [bacterium]|nr:hypothetical protein [bacterium]HOL65837.1 hypothetical protein [bacterium]HPP11113.1 hypothetical protein [bacterium]